MHIQESSEQSIEVQLTASMLFCNICLYLFACFFLASSHLYTKVALKPITGQRLYIQISFPFFACAVGKALQLFSSSESQPSPAHCSAQGLEIAVRHRLHP